MFNDNILSVRAVWQMLLHVYTYIVQRPFDAGWILNSMP